MHPDPATELRKVFDVIPSPAITKPLLEEATDNAVFCNLWRKRKIEFFSEWAMKAGDVGDMDTFKTRKGKVGGYRNYLDEEDLARLDETIAKHGQPGCEWYFAISEA